MKAFESLNKLQFCVVGNDAIQLPTIVVLGAPSSGKSSLIESIVGKSFLPRGVGIVTRRPLILQLVYTPKDDKEHRSAENGTLDVDDWGVFLHKENAVYKDFEEIRKEIENEIDRMAGVNNRICLEPITLKIYSKSVVNLTLIDLPGLTEFPVGDQPEDIKIQIRSLVLKYISNPNSIILTIIAATVGMGTNESLGLAREVDPDGRRTLIVLTKLDLMDEGTDATDVLCGKEIPVKLGIIGVVNRSQRDIIDKKTIQEGLQKEAAFLQRKYPTLADRNGTPYLAKTLNRLLMHHIRDCLPDLKKRVNDMIFDAETNLKSYDEPGKITYINPGELYGGARIKYIFHEVFGKNLDSIDPLENLTKLDILTSIKNITGAQTEAVLKSFELLVKGQIDLLKEPSLRCVSLIYNEMQIIIEQCEMEVQHEFQRFPKLREKIIEIVSQLIDNRLTSTKASVEMLIAKESAYINIEHPDFDKNKILFSYLTQHAKKYEIEENDIKCKSFVSKEVNTNILYENIEFACDDAYDESEVPIGLSPFLAKVKIPSQEVVQKPVNFLGGGSLLDSHQFTEKEKRDCEIYEKLIKSYFKIIKKSIQDSVPKVIMLKQVNDVKSNLNGELIKFLIELNNLELESLLAENELIVKERKEAVELLKNLNQAARIINEFHVTSMELRH